MKLTKSIGLILVLIIGLVTGFSVSGYAETDVTSKVQVAKSALSYDRVAKQSYLNVSVKNISNEVLLTPITVVIDSVSPSTVSVANADGVTAEGKSYRSFVTESGQLPPGATTAGKKLIFANPTAAKFSFSTKVIGLLPDAVKMAGPAGGVIEFIDSQDPNVKVIIEIPPGALSSASHIAISEDTSSNRNPPLGYNSIGPRIKLTSSTPLSGFVKVQLPFFGNISKDNLVFISHYDEKLVQFTIVPVDVIDVGLKYIKFSMPSFCTIEPVEIFGLPKSDQINMDIYFKRIYPRLMELVSNYQNNINTTTSQDEKYLQFIQNATTVATKSVDLYKSMYTLNSAADYATMANNQISDFIVTSLDSKDPNKEWINPSLNLSLCVYQGVAESVLNGSPYPYPFVLKSCAVETIKQALNASIMFNNALDIYKELRRINEAWITADYLKLFYSNSGDYNKMAAALINKVPATEDAIINEVARYSYKDGLFTWDDYDLGRAKNLIAQAKDTVDKIRRESDPDGDLVLGDLDKCPGTAYGDNVDAKGCSQSDLLNFDNDGDGFTPNQGDCNDNDPAMNPNTVWYQDADNDGYSDGTTRSQCLRGLYYNKLASELKSLDVDCNDNDPTVGPSTWYRDADGDGYGNPNVSILACGQPTGYVSNNTDCYDNDPAIHPGATEIPGDGIDQDCSGTDQLPLPVTPGTFTATGSMKNIRYHHTATLLPNGKVLVAGGVVGATTPVQQAELFDPQTGTFSLTGSLNDGRYFHTATLLPNNKVLITGGNRNTVYFNSSEIYDPATGTFQRTGNMHVARTFHTSTLLNNGKVLITGGAGTGDVYLNTAELYDPSTGQFTLTGTMNIPKNLHTATLLNSGEVLIVGGNLDKYATGTPICEIYDPVTGLFTKTGGLMAGRQGHAAFKLSNGKVLIAGGATAYSNWTFPTISELFDPQTNTFSQTGPISQTRTIGGGGVIGADAILFNGTALLAGGAYYDTSNKIWKYRNSAEIYNPLTGLFSPAASMAVGRHGHSVTLLAHGQVLVTGGIERYSGSNGLSSAELFTP